MYSPHEARPARRRLWILARSTLILLPCSTALSTADPPPVFQLAEQQFGTKGHFGRAHAWADLDGNGLLDVLAGGHDDGLHAYYQESPLQFRLVDDEVGLANYNEPLYGILSLDFDRDGDNDIVLNQVGFGQPTSTPSLRFLRNVGNQGFVEQTAAVGFAEWAHGFGVAALDYDHDGWLDVYVVNHRSANALYRNLGDGRFENVTEAAGVDALNGRMGDSCGIATLDYDNDGWTDIFVPQRDQVSEEHPLGNNVLYHNQGDGTFVNRAVEAGVSGHSSAFAASAADLNNDGWTDLYVGTFNFGMNGYPETDYCNVTYLNQGDGTFVDVSMNGGAAYIGGTMGLAADDVDNDGAIDIYVGNGGPFELQIEEQIFYRGLGDGSFVEQTNAAGLYSLARGHGSSFLDLDGDGDLDLFTSLGGHTLSSLHHDYLYLNTGPVGRGLEVMARGADCPLEGVGVAVEVFATGLHRRREIDATGGFDSQRPPLAWFGLGNLAQLDSVVLSWPCGRRQLLRDVATNDHILVQEPLGRVAVLDFALLARRAANGSALLELTGDIAELSLSSVELSRRLESRSEWTLLPVAAQIQDENLSWTDPDAPLDRRVHYRLRARLGSGSAWITREGELVAIQASPVRLSASPNPFQHAVALRAPFSQSDAQLKVYDARGRIVRTLGMDQAILEGANWLWNWNGRDDAGDHVARGVYLVALRGADQLVQSRIVKLER